MVNKNVVGNIHPGPRETPKDEQGVYSQPCLSADDGSALLVEKADDRSSAIIQLFALEEGRSARKIFPGVQNERGENEGDLRQTRSSEQQSFKMDAKSTAKSSVSCPISSDDHICEQSAQNDSIKQVYYANEGVLMSNIGSRQRQNCRSLPLRVCSHYQNTVI